MELYNELRENWERLYWDEGYSKKLAQDHANYDSTEDDDEDFNPYRWFLHSSPSVSVSFGLVGIISLRINLAPSLRFLELLYWIRAILVMKWKIYWQPICTTYSKSYLDKKCLTFDL